MNQSRRSRQTGMTGHDRPEYPLLLNGKDKNTIEVGSGDELIKVLELVKTSVNNGELDAAIEVASVKVRERFKM